MAELVGVRVTGTGSYLPERVVTNEELSRTLDTSDEWIRTRTGIGSRHFIADDQATSDLAVAAARDAMADAGVTAEDLDLIVVCTMTPDSPMPITAALVQRELNAPNVGGFDLNSACSGFLLGFSTVANLIRTGSCKCALVIGAETMSRITDQTDRSTAVIFADGAGAVVLQPSEDRSSDLLAVRRGMRGDPDVLTIRGGGSRIPPSHAVIDEKKHLIEMKGRETFKFAVTTFAELITKTCEDAGVKPTDLKAIVPHQVNMRIIEKACSRAGVEVDRLVLNIERLGNTSAASVPIALNEGARKKRFGTGDLVLMVAFGGGLSWASALVRW